jgi:hypothetical protein
MHEKQSPSSGLSHTAALSKSVYDAKHRCYLDLIQKTHYHYIRKPHLSKKR